MDLDAYLAVPGAKSLTALSAEVGISKGRLSQLRHATDWPPELALKIERATSGKIDAGVISPIIAEARLPAPGDSEAAA
jgi:DNA-binding transcriptional regulator YdaS (Cro superfamily)